MQKLTEVEELNKAQRIEKAKKFLRNFVEDCDYYCLIGAIEVQFDLDRDTARYLVDHDGQEA